MTHPGIATKIEELKNRFTAVEGWEARYKLLIELGQHLPELAADFRNDQFRVKGCTSQVWLHAKLSDSGRVLLSADSDSTLVKGLVAMLLQVYSDQEPDDILKTQPTFIKELGFESALTPSRANGLNAMVKQIYLYAQAFALLKRS